jgi:hypothetical protein
MIAEWLAASAALSIVTAFVQPSPSPGPTPAMKTITHVKSSPLCTEFRSLVLPLTDAQAKNQPLMQHIAKETQEYRKYSNPVFRDPPLLQAGQIDMAAANILQNLAPMEKLLAASWKRSPKGASPKIDAVRQRVQNIIDLQRAIANQEVQFAGYVIDTSGMDRLAAADQAFGTGRLGVAAPAPPQNAVEVAASASPPPPPEDDPRLSSTTLDRFVAKDLRVHSLTFLTTSLNRESLALAPIAATLAYDCGNL